MNVFRLLLTQPLANGLILFYKLLGQNLGLAIIGFSVFLRFILTPLTRPYMESMRKMKQYGPQLEKLKNKHKGDKQKQMQAQAEFYRQKGINPGAGCLPYLLQIVILIAFLNVFMAALSTDGNIADKFNEFLYEPLKFRAQETVNTRFLFLNLAKPDMIQTNLLPFSLPGPFLLLAALVQVVSAKMSAPFVEKEKAMAKKTTDVADDFQVAFQSSAIYMFPLMTLLIGMRFPSGLVLYWTVFSFYQAFQQYQASGWGGITPWLLKLGLIKSDNHGSKKLRKRN
jgi:YidC/Oxa1 family membrane protein insertase